MSLPAGAAKIIALAGRTFAGVQHPATASATAQAAQPLGNWTLTLDEWLPGGPGDRSSVTRHREHAFANVPLKSWTEIPSIKDAVGVGSYFTTFQAPAAEQLGAVVDLGTLIKPGRNTIRVEVASTLLNRLRVHRPAEFGSRAPAITGLLGPVTLIPY